ncbi:ThiF family adenylyltransferase [Pandoraea sp. E26]|uniref:ThiF family adenylyltransferase n=1 Tax=Pandoraea sp. E26 TaxID=1427365 RepID=UPI00048D1688|nr:ThiF family adenylyltransferase [Pandoraea sp. E26]
MTQAFDKNVQALESLFKSKDLALRLAGTRIAVVMPPSQASKAALLLADFLVDCLARLWPQIDFVGEGNEQLVERAVGVARSGGGVTTGFTSQWSPPYACVIAVGCDAPSQVSPTVRIGADGWGATIGENASCGDSANPTGPAFAAALGAAQLFLQVFKLELRDTGACEIESCVFDVRTICSAPGLEVTDLHLSHTTFVGVGAVTHGLMGVLERWPFPVTGDARLVDADSYSASNGQRYAFMSSDNAGKLKVEAVRARLAAVHPNLRLESYAEDLNTHCASHGYPNGEARYVVGLDSAESRRHAALKYPGHCVNMWTEGVRIGAARYFPTDESACLGCDYLEDVSKLHDEVAEVHQITGLAPHVVRELLDSARGLTQAEATTVSATAGLPIDRVVGEPLRSVLPLACAIGKLQVAKSGELADVPFAFSSLMAGVAGFVMLLRDVTGPFDRSEGWTEHVFKPPHQLMWTRRIARLECACCAPVNAAESEPC